MAEPSDLVGLVELVELLGISRSALDVRRHRGQLPEPWAIISGTPLWLRSDFDAPGESSQSGRLTSP